MKKLILAAAAALSLAFCTGVEIGRSTAPPAEIDKKPEALETILMYSEWTDDNGRRLKFMENSKGELEGEEFRWNKSEEELKLNYRPQSEFSADHILKILNDDSGLAIEMENTKFHQNFIIKEEQETDKELLLKLGRQIADYAAGFEGCKYLYGGKSPETGFDCSGLVYYVYEHFGYGLNRVAADQAKQGIPVQPEELQPGDVLCFYTSGNYIGHVGIYLGDRTYVHAMGAAYGVVNTSLDDPYINHKFEARRMIGSPELINDKASAKTQ